MGFISLSPAIVWLFVLYRAHFCDYFDFVSVLALAFELNFEVDIVCADQQVQG